MLPGSLLRYQVKISQQPVEASAVAVHAHFCLLAQDRLKAYVDPRCWAECTAHKCLLGSVDINYLSIYIYMEPSLFVLLLALT